MVLYSSHLFQFLAIHLELFEWDILKYFLKKLQLFIFIRFSEIKKKKTVYNNGLSDL